MQAAVIIHTPKIKQQTSRPLVRMTLYPGEVGRLPAGYRHICLRSGWAWLTSGGRDIILRPGARKTLPAAGREAVLVSVLGEETVVLEAREA